MTGKAGRIEKGKIRSLIFRILSPALPVLPVFPVLST